MLNGHRGHRAAQKSQRHLTAVHVSNFSRNVFDFDFINKVIAGRSRRAMERYRRWKVYCVSVISVRLSDLSGHSIEQEKCIDSLIVWRLNLDPRIDR